MKETVFKTSGVCAPVISYKVDDEGCLHDVKFTGGCSGNLKAIGLIVEGRKASEIADLFEGNTCGFKQTSCTDQLSKSIRNDGF